MHFPGGHDGVPSMPGRAARRVVTRLSTAPCQCSRMNPDSRKNCGFPGITSEQCFAAGCCFDTTVPGVPWCFTPLPMQGNCRAAGPLPVSAVRSPQPRPRLTVLRTGAQAPKGKRKSPFTCVHTWSPKGQPFAPFGRHMWEPVCVQNLFLCI